MTLKKAFEILTLHLAGEFKGDINDLHLAKEIGRQAILRMQTLRSNPYLSPSAPLPSETEA